ncbi:hypothetical protein ACPV5W_07025 [Vibrio astriarenae]
MANDINLQEQEDDFNAKIEQEIDELVAAGVNAVEARQQVFEKYRLTS